MANKVFQVVDWSGATFDGNDLTTSVATIYPGLLVVKDAAADTVSLAAASGSAPLGFAYGSRDLVYKPTTNTFATGEQLVVVNGHGFALISADYFTSGSIPADVAAGRDLYAAANGLIANNGTFKIGRLVSQKAVTDPTSGNTGASNTVALIEFNLVP